MTYSKLIEEIVAEQNDIENRCLQLSQRLQAAMQLSNDDIVAMFKHEIYFIFEITPPLQVYATDKFVLNNYYHVLAVAPYGDFDEVFDNHPDWFHEQRRYHRSPEVICIPDDETIEKLLEKIKSEVFGGRE